MVRGQFAAVSKLCRSCQHGSTSSTSVMLCTEVGCNMFHDGICYNQCSLGTVCFVLNRLSREF